MTAFGLFTSQYLIIFLLILELLAIFILVILIISRRIFISYQEPAEKKVKDYFSDYIFKLLKGDKIPLEEAIFKRHSSPIILLRVLENYDRQIKSPQWSEIKNFVSNQYLLPIGRKFIGSQDWIERNFSARSFALCPEEQDRDSILSLMDDPQLLVAIIAAKAAIKLELKEGVIKIINKMNRDKEFSYDRYRDLLVKNFSPKIFNWIEEYATEQKNETAHLACLDVLSSVAMTIKAPFLQEDLKSENIQIRRAAVRLCAYNPQVSSLNILLRSLDDSDNEVREESAYGLRHFPLQTSFQKLENALQDSYWKVRLNAASSLKGLGRAGISILQRQSPDKNKHAYEVAQYALEFD